MSAKKSEKIATHSSRTLLRGRNPNLAVLKKSVGAKQILSSRKNSFALPRPNCISPRHTARILGGQNPERKTPFPFSKEISPPPNQEIKECFFFRGCRRVREAVWRGDSSSVRFRSESPRAPRVAH